MIYLKIEGRLGNQLFQYAFAKKIQNYTKEKICIDFSNFSNRRAEDGFENQLKYFNTKFIEIDGIEWDSFNYIQKKVYKYYKKRKNVKSRDRMQEHVFELKWIKILNLLGIYELTQGYYPFKMKSLFKNKMLIGYFESQEYFKEIEEQIRSDFTPKEPPIEQNQELYKIIQNTESICVSIRRGDFVDNPVNKKILDICTTSYYSKGVDIIKEKVKKENCSIIVFSDDVEWCRENIKFSDMNNVYYESGKDPVWEKLRLMYNCKHFVISNSTFSWWAQYLSSNPEKIVVAPAKWRKYENAIDIYTPSMILVDTETLRVVK